MKEQSPRSDSSARRARLQGKILVWIGVPLLVLAALCQFARALPSSSVDAWLLPFLVSLVFALLAWLSKAATLPASAIGFLVCMTMVQPFAERGVSLLQTGLPALVTLVLLTTLATRFGRSKKEATDLAERRDGRRASQVVANLGVAALCSALGWYAGSIAALAEAAADTVSSEVGQAIGGRVWLLTSGRPVPIGTNGGISFAGSIAGTIAAALVVGAGMLHQARLSEAIIVFAAACAGLFFDSLMGATLENRGYLKNDLVNLISTAFAAALAIAGLAVYARLV